MTRAAITEGLRLIFQGIAYLEKASPYLPFTIDGRLGGDIGEVIAALEYDVVLHDVSQAKHDAVTSDGRNVQIMATFKDFLTFRTVPDYYLGFKLYPDGQHEEIFNGPGQVIADRFIGREVIADLFLARKGIGVDLHIQPALHLAAPLTAAKEDAERHPRRHHRLLDADRITAPLALGSRYAACWRAGLNPSVRPRIPWRGCQDHAPSDVSHPRHQC